MRLLFLFTLLGRAMAVADSTVVGVLDAAGVSESSVQRIQRATEAALKQLSTLALAEGPAFRRGAPRRCADDCAQALVSSVGAPAVVVLDLRALDPKAERVAVEVQFWLDGEKRGVRRGEASVEGFEAAVRPLLDSLVPAWARRGFGALALTLEAGSVVKVDHRPSTPKPGELLALPAGPHQVDVVSADGHAVLQRVEIVEGARVRLENAAVDRAMETAVGQARRTSLSPLRLASYGTFMAGAALMAGGLVAGALGKGTAAGLSPCSASTRDCATLDAVLERNRQAQSYANTGNVLLGLGGALVAVGAGLFVIDFVTE